MTKYTDYSLQYLLAWLLTISPSLWIKSSNNMTPLSYSLSKTYHKITCEKDFSTFWKDIIYLEGRVTERGERHTEVETDRDRKQIFHSVVRSPNSCNSQCWLQCNQSQDSHLGLPQTYRRPSTWAIFCCFPSRGLEVGQLVLEPASIWDATTLALIFLVVPFFEAII